MAKTMSATDRVLEAADGAGLGPWSESDEINVGDNDATMPIFGVGLLVGCSAWFLVPLGWPDGCCANRTRSSAG